MENLTTIVDEDPGTGVMIDKDTADRGEEDRQPNSSACRLQFEAKCMTSFNVPKSRRADA